MLTPRQKELLDYIRAYIDELGYSPSFDEMKAAVGLKSKSGIHRLLAALEERGFIRKLPHRARAIELVGYGGRSWRCECCGHVNARARLKEIA